jgi:hypothetical protein
MEVRIYTEQIKAKILDCKHRIQDFTKDISVLNYKLPVSATAMWNPANKIARLQLAVSLF